MVRVFALFCLSAILFFTPISTGSQAAAAESGETPDISAIIAEYRQEIPAQMKSENIPGLAIVVVDSQGTLWSEGFGYTDWDQKTPVTADTLFSIQSMSKSFTATAAMLAAQDGLVDLDAPIAAYLPDFHLNSIFEQDPEQKITLRMLLSHTAGLEHEAPLGGNFDQPRPTFEQHITSIQDTWLRFPVGQGYHYSNLGIDLAGYILQVRSGKPFHQYVKDRVFDPLGMVNSTLDFDKVHATKSRAIGHNPLYLGPLSPRSEWAIIPSGGVWTTANDISRYLRFHINIGALDGTRLLRQDLAETMYTPPNEAARLDGYALGLAVSHEMGTRELQHGGGGFGFNSNMIILPECKLGVVVLTNAEHENLVSLLPGEILSKILMADYSLYHNREAASSIMAPALTPSLQADALSAAELAGLISSHALPSDAEAIQRRKEYSGTYLFSRWGIPVTTAQVAEDGGQLTYAVGGETGSLVEVQPGLFFDLGGTAVDLRGSVPRIGNIGLRKINAAARPAWILFYSLCGVIFLSTFIYWPVQALVRRARQKKGLTDFQTGRLPGITGLLAGLAALMSLVCLVFIARVPYLVDVPWPAPYPELLWYQFAGMSLPYAALLLAAAAASLVALAWIRRSGERGIRIYFTLVALALLAFNLAVLV